MKFNVLSQLQYEVLSPTTFVLNIHALRTSQQTILEEKLIIDPYFQTEELAGVNGDSRLVRLEVPEATTLNVTYQALVENACSIVNGSDIVDVSVAQLDPGVLIYLNPSRYCQSDKLFRFARNTFGHIVNPFEKVNAINEWIHGHVEYLSGSTNAETSAFDTVTEQAGVCRDFAHLGIALCRALTIPARYFTGYAYQLQPPDFHACFEAWLGGQWVLFDATGLSVLNGLVKIASGRDAADSAVANIFGNAVCQQMSVSCDLAPNETFEAFHPAEGSLTGIAYS